MDSTPRNGTVNVGGENLDYEVSNLIESNHAAFERAGEVREILGVPQRRLGPDDLYPQTDQYTWQEFAGFAIEFGGYFDITLVDPYTLDRLHVANVTRDRASVWDALRAVIDVAEAIDFAAGNGKD